ncbi:hypothetical protein ACFLS1_08025, partial [Verrucomicrobiota bacterium]
SKAENHCPCYDSKERCVICAHVIAVALTIVMRTTDPLREKKYQEELRRASRLAKVDESEYIKRVSADAQNAVPAQITITVKSGFDNGLCKDTIIVDCAAEYSGKTVPLEKVPRNLPLTFSKKDESILIVLEDISEGPAKSSLELNRFDFLNLVRLHAGREMSCANGTTFTVNDIKMTTIIKMDMDRETGDLILRAHTELPFMNAGEFPSYIIEGKSGWVYGNGNLWPLKNLLPGPYHSIYKDPVIIARPNVLRFLKQELPLLENRIFPLTCSALSQAYLNLNARFLATNYGLPQLSPHDTGTWN